MVSGPIVPSHIQLQRLRSPGEAGPQLPGASSLLVYVTSLMFGALKSSVLTALLLQGNVQSLDVNCGWYAE